MTPDYIASRQIIRDRAAADVERAERRKARRWRLLRLAAILAGLWGLLWAAWRIGYETGLIAALTKS